MLDYKLLHAFAAIIEEKSFERAARSLHITQSAISQRIKSLEDQIGQPVLMRGSPPEATEHGKALLKHFHQVRALEEELQGSREAMPGEFRTVKIALNNDSLYYWFLEALVPLLKKERFLLELYVDDERKTDAFLRDGTVFGAISAIPKPPAGCKAEYLGALRYVCVCTPEFKRRYFAGGVKKASLLKAPYLRFNEKDTYHNEYLQKYFRMNEEPPRIMIPSTKGFADLARAGIGYGLVGEPDVERDLISGRLVEVAPGKHMDLDLYWHSWYLQPVLYQQISEAIYRNTAPYLWR